MGIWDGSEKERGQEAQNKVKAPASWISDTNEN